MSVAWRSQWIRSMEWAKEESFWSSRTLTLTNQSLFHTGLPASDIIQPIIHELSIFSSYIVGTDSLHVLKQRVPMFLHHSYALFYPSQICANFLGWRNHCATHYITRLISYSVGCFSHFGQVWKFFIRHPKFSLTFCCSSIFVNIMQNFHF